MNRIWIDGKEFTNCVKGLEDFELSYSYNEENITVNYGVSNSLEFYQEANDIISDWLFSCPLNGLPVEVYESCCDKTFTFIIDPTDVTVCCTSCKSTSRLVTDTEDINKYHCLKEELVISDGFLAAYKHQRWVDVLTNVNEPSHFVGYYIREILQYHTQRCGVKLDDCGIFTDPNSPYYNATWLPKGCNLLESGGTAQPNNFNPGQVTTYDICDFLKEISPLWKSDFDIKDCTLRFWPICKLNEITETIDLIDPCTESDLCLKLGEEERCRRRNVRYEDNGVNLHGNDFNHSYIYNIDPKISKICNENLPVTVSPGGTEQVTGGGQFFTPFQVEGNCLNNSYILITNGVNRDQGTIITAQCGASDSGLLGNYPMSFQPLNGCPSLYDFQDECNTVEDCVFVMDDFCFKPDSFCEVVELIQKEGLNIGFKTVKGDYKMSRKQGEIVLNFKRGIVCLREIITF